MELRHILSIIWKWMWLIVLATGIAAASAYVATSQSPKIYMASTTLLVGQSIQSTNVNSADIYASQTLAQTYVQIVKMDPVLNGAINALGLKMSSDQLRGMVSAGIIPQTQLIELRVVDTNPRRAQAIADEMANQLILQGPVAKEKEQSSRRDFVQKQSDELQKKIQDAQKRIDDLSGSIQVTSSAREIADKQQQIATLQNQMLQWQQSYTSLASLLSYQSPNYLSLMEPARLPTAPIAPNVSTSVMLAAAFGLILSVGAAFLIEYIDDTIKTTDDITGSLKLAVLGVIARISGDKPGDKLIAALHPRSSHAEAFRLFRTNIQVSDIDHPIKTFLVTSPNPSEGKSITAANLAVVMAQAGLRVILVDSDMRRPSQHRIFGLSKDFGLTDILRQPTPVLDGFIQPTTVDNLRLITTGQTPPNPAELLGSKRMQSLVEHLQSEADIVIFDTPPCLPLADATILSRQVNGVVLVLDAGSTRRDAAARAKDALERAGARVLGAALNRINPRGNGYYYYYYYYSSDGERKKRQPQKSSSSFLSRFRSSKSKTPSEQSNGE